MGQASIQALAETLGKGGQEQAKDENAPFPPTTAAAAAAWVAFFATVSGCMMPLEPAWHRDYAPVDADRG